jgi:hypothetical protein
MLLMQKNICSHATIIKSRFYRQNFFFFTPHTHRIEPTAHRGKKEKVVHLVSRDLVINQKFRNINIDFNFRILEK